MTDLQRTCMRACEDHCVTADDWWQPPPELRSVAGSCARRGWFETTYAHYYLRYRPTDAGRQALAEAEKPKVSRWEKQQPAGQGALEL